MLNYNRKSYLKLLLISFILTIIFNTLLFQKNKELTEYWGTDYIAEIYQHDYSFNKFLIQASTFSVYFIFFSIVLFIFNIKNKLVIFIILLLTLCLIFISNFSLNYALTEDSLSAIGAHDLGKK